MDAQTVFSILSITIIIFFLIDNLFFYPKRFKKQFKKNYQYLYNTIPQHCEGANVSSYHKLLLLKKLKTINNNYDKITFGNFFCYKINNKFNKQIFNNENINSFKFIFEEINQDPKNKGQEDFSKDVFEGLNEKIKEFFQNKIIKSNTFVYLLRKRIKKIFNLN